jgi:hypothetical protein
MASISTSELGSVAAIEVAAGGSAASTAPLPLALPRDHVQTPVGRPIDQRGRLLRRLLLAADTTALCAAFAVNEMAFGYFQPAEVLLLVLSVPLWVLLANGHGLYYLDSHRADYRGVDEIGPVLQMATLWSWCTLLGLSLLGRDDSAVPRVALFWALMVVLLMTFRSLSRTIARRRAWYVQHALVLGPPGEVAAIVRKIQRHPEWGIVAASCGGAPDGDARPVRDSDPALIASPLPGDDDLVALARKLEVDRVMLAPALSESRARQSWSASSPTSEFMST